MNREFITVKKGFIMALERLSIVLNQSLQDLDARGVRKGKEMVITSIKPAQAPYGPRYLVQGYEGKEFIKMNANSYLGMSLKPELIEAEEQAVRKYGVGPGAVRFISGTHLPHIQLEEKLAKFHKREAAMLFSAAYATSLGVIFPLLTKDTIVISDELNHNCIINAMRMARPADKKIYKHNQMPELERCLQEAVGKAKRVVVVTDGIFSMRGDNAPLQEFVNICNKYDAQFEEGVVSVMDDSHGVGAFGATGRGTEEYTGAKVDVLVGTLGKAFGVNGGYVVSSKVVIDHLRETAPTYIYSNPITVGEACAAMKAIDILDSEKGKEILAHLKEVTNQFRNGLKEAGLETLPGDHPVVPLMIRDTAKTTKLVKYLTENGILATGMNFPVVPKGDEEIRFQISADHTPADIDYVLQTIKKFFQPA